MAHFERAASGEAHQQGAVRLRFEDLRQVEVLGSAASHYPSMAHLLSPRPSGRCRRTQGGVLCDTHRAPRAEADLAVAKTRAPDDQVLIAREQLHILKLRSTVLVLSQQKYLLR